MKTKIIQNIKSIILALILVVGVSYVYAAWSNPPSNPPLGNVDAPINVGELPQTKTGNLTLNKDLKVLGKSVFEGNVQIVGGTPGLGKVLTALNADGTVGWQVLPSGPVTGSVGGGCYEQYSGGTLSGSASKSTTPWGAATVAGGTCTCPQGYSRYQTYSSDSTSNIRENTARAWMCIKN